MKRAVATLCTILLGSATLSAQDQFVTVTPPPGLRANPSEVTVFPPPPLEMYKLMHASSQLRTTDEASLLFPHVPTLPKPAEPPQIDTAPTTEKQPLSIHAAIEKALAANLDIEIQRLQPRLARADTLTSQGALDPTLSLSGQYEEIADPLFSNNTSANGAVTEPGKYRNYNVAPSVTIPTAPGTTLTASAPLSNTANTWNNFNDQFNGNTTLQLRQPLLKNFGSDVNLANIRIARKGEDISVSQFRAEVETVIQSVYSAYYELLFAKGDYEAKLKSFQLAEQLGEDNSVRLRVGTISPLELSQALTEAAARRSDVIEAEGTLRVDENNLKRLLTRNLAAWLDARIIPTDQMMVPGVIPSRTEEIATGLLQRQDYIAQLKTAEQQNIKILYAQNQTLPQIDLIGSYAQNSISRYVGVAGENLFIRDDNDWFVGMALTIPIGERTAKGQLDRAKLEKEQILLQTKRLEQQIIADIDNASLNLATTTRRVSATRQAREYAELTLHAEEERLKAGASTTYNVLQAQRDFANSQTEELRAMADFNKAVVSLKFSQGILLPYSGVQIRNP